MSKMVDARGLYFVGKFNELVLQLSAIEDQHMTLREYIRSYRKKLN